jgi:uncharacterized protein (TIGR00369 family)
MAVLHFVSILERMGSVAGEEGAAMSFAEVPEALRRVVNRSPFFRRLKMVLLDARDGTARIGLEVRPFHLNTQGIVHGGVLCSLGDVASAVAVGTGLEPHERPRTLAMEMRYYAPGLPEGRLIAVGTIIKRIGPRVSASASVQDDQGRVLCEGYCRFVIVQVKDAGSTRRRAEK